MDRLHYLEMVRNVSFLIEEGALLEKNIYLFGHCNATEELANFLLDKSYRIRAILDNNVAKQGNVYREIMISTPNVICTEVSENVIVLIVSRFYETMKTQLRQLGFNGEIIKLVDYNTYADYSLDADVIKRKKSRIEYGLKVIETIEKRHPNCFRIFCPLVALGDVYYCMSYLPYFMKEREITDCVICVASKGCGKVVSLFGKYQIEILEQYDLDAAIQASLYKQDTRAFISHQDRPYVIDLHKALYIKQITLEQIYCCGIFGLPIGTSAVEPTNFSEYPRLDRIKPGKTIILSPYAKSVTELNMSVWEQIVKKYKQDGYECYTNVVGDESPIKGTLPISPEITEVKSVVERAGIFIGIRSGLCDILKSAKAKKIALYPNYNYSDTRWKAIDMYWLEGWENIVVDEDFV